MSLVQGTYKFLKSFSPNAELKAGISPRKLWFDPPVFQFSCVTKADAGTDISPINAVLPLSAFNNHLRNCTVLIRRTSGRILVNIEHITAVSVKAGQK